MEHLDLSCCNLARLPVRALLSAPLLRTLRLAGNTGMMFYPENIRTIVDLGRLQELMNAAGWLAGAAGAGAYQPSPSRVQLPPSLATV